MSLLRATKNFWVSFILTFLICTNLFAVDDLGPRKNLFKIDKIQVLGLKKVEAEAVLEKISSRTGMVLDNYLLKKDIEKIYSLKFFEYVEAQKVVKKRKNILVFRVKEKPIITEIKFSGNNEVDDEDLAKQLKSKAFAILDINTIQEDIKTIQKQYEEKGYFLATAEYSIVKKSTENVVLKFKINEFDKVKVKKISFLGNQAFSDKELKDLMETQEDSFFSFLSNSGSFKEFNFQVDIEKLKYFYKTKGHLQVNIGTPEVTVSEDKRWVFITVKINEGPRFTVNDVSFQGELLFDDEFLKEKISTASEKVYSEQVLREDIQQLTELYQDQGYAFANVLRTLHLVPGENKVDVEFSFEKGKIAYIGKIVIKGNNQTRDKVIRRELKIHEGMKYSGSGIRESKENISRLGFFEPKSVVLNTITRKDKDDVLDLEIVVKERNTGQISLGAGYSTDKKGFLNASIAQNNFRGLGQHLEFSTSFSNTEKSFNLGFTEPYFMDTKWTAGADVFHQNNKGTSFDEKNIGGDIRVGHPIFEYTKAFVTYKIVDKKIVSLKDTTLVNESGLTSSVRVNIQHDKRNNAFEPSGGYFLGMGTEYAGLGGDKKWWKNELDFRYFYRVVGDLVFRSRLYTAKLLEVDSSKPLTRGQKFTLGGSRNLRGFKSQYIGPRVASKICTKTEGTCTEAEKEEVLFNDGGTFASYTTFELEHPLAQEAGLKWVVFFDAGDAREFDNFKLHMDYGFGIRWFSPIGVLRFEFGFPVRPQPEGASSQFYFDIGQLF